MATVLENHLQDYAHNFVAIYTKYDYDSQISAWKDHINFLADFQKEALNRHQGVLDQAKKQIAEQRAEAFGLAMMALSMIAGPALSWIAGKIQYKWFPKLTQKHQQRVEYVKLQTHGWKTELQVFGEDVHDKVMAKVFGDIGKQVVGWGTDKAIKTVMGSFDKASIETAAASGEVSFKTNLEHALTKQAQSTSDAIMGMGISIMKNDHYGAECLQRLRNVNPLVRGRNLKDDQLQPLAERMIIDDINARRQEWADQWLFYGNNPGSTTGVTDAIERELWGMWILNEHLQFKMKDTWVEGRQGVGGMSHRQWVEGATFGEDGVPEAVLRRLADFGVVVGRTKQQKREEALRWEEEHKPQPSQENLEKAYRDLVDRNRPPNNAPHRPQVIDLEADKRERERQQRERQERIRRDLQRDLDRQGMHPPTEDRPVIDVGSGVDTQQEIDALEAWALHHRARLIAGQLEHTKRTLTSIDQIVPR